MIFAQLLDTRRLASQVLIAILAITALVTGVATVFIARDTLATAVENTEKNTQDVLGSVSKSLELAYAAAARQAEQQMATFERLMGGALVLAEGKTATGEAGDIPTVKAGDTMLNGNLDVLQHMKQLNGVEAAVLIRDNGRWIRAATLLKDKAGKSQVGSVIPDTEFSAKTLNAGEQATSVVKRAGKWYALHVKPIKDSSGQVYAGLTTRVDLTADMKGVLDFVAQSRVADGVGQFLVLAPGEGGKQEVLVAPQGEGETATRAALFQRIAAVDAGFEQTPDWRVGQQDLLAWRHVPAWNWTLAVVGAKEAFLEDEHRQLWVLVLVLLGSATLTGLLTYLLMRRALKPVALVVEGITRLGHGDLTRDVPEGPRGSANEIHRMAGQTNAARLRMAELAGRIRIAGDAVGEGSGQTLNALQQIDASARVQSEATNSVAAAIEQLSVSIAQVADHTRQAHAASQESHVAAQSGHEVVGRTVADITALAERIASSAVQVEGLDAASREISRVVSAIKEVAEQTNLLALNAAIEAARAGESGRGFSVVADEVRLLAERTKAATHEISGLINRVQQQSGEVASAMRDANGHMQRSAESASEVGVVLGHIRSAAERTATVVADIANAALEQRAASEQIASRIEQIAQHTEESAAAVTESVVAATAIQQQVGELRDGIGTLRV
ncbi:methyl-accepting chemotaxis protein [Chitinimonas naiadis]